MKVFHYLHHQSDLREEEVADQLVVGQEGCYLSPDYWTEEDESVPRWKNVDVSSIELNNGILVLVEGYANGGEQITSVPIREDFFGGEKESEASLRLLKPGEEIHFPPCLCSHQGFPPHDPNHLERILRYDGERLILIVDMPN